MRHTAVLIFSVVAILLIGYGAIREWRKTVTTKTETVSASGFISLSPPRYESAVSVEKCLHERRSVREYGGKPLSLDEISQLLWAAQGVTHGKRLRTAPSAGALYPLETYLVAGAVGGLSPGIYRYLPDSHQLRKSVAGDMRGELCKASLSQDSIRNAPAVIIFSAVFARATGKYGKRGIRYTHMEVGHAAQNVCLQAVSLDLGAVVIGAFDDEAVQRVLSMSSGEEPMVLVPVGRKRDH